MDTDLQRHRLLDSLNGARFEDLLGDLHYCARCQIQFSTMYAFINHRTDSCHMMTRASSEVTLNAVSTLYHLFAKDIVGRYTYIYCKGVMKTS